MGFSVEAGYRRAVARGRPLISCWRRRDKRLDKQSRVWQTVDGDERALANGSLAFENADWDAFLDRERTANEMFEFAVDLMRKYGANASQLY